MKRLYFLFSLTVLSLCFGSLAALESRIPSTQEIGNAKFETTVLTDDVITYEFKSNSARNSKRSQSCAIASKLSDCASTSSKSPIKDKLTCYSTSDLFTSSPGTAKLEVFECSSLDRKDCHRVYFLKQGKDYRFGQDEVCVSTDRNRVCADNRDKYGSSGQCYRFYDISIPSCDVKSTIVVGNSKEAIKNPKGTCLGPLSPSCEFEPNNIESFENLAYSQYNEFTNLEIFNGEATIDAGYLFKYGEWMNYDDGNDFFIRDGKLAVSASNEDINIVFKQPIQRFNGFFGNAKRINPIKFEYYNSKNELVYRGSLNYDAVKEKDEMIYYGFCSQSNDVKRVRIIGYEQVMDLIGFRRMK